MSNFDAMKLAVEATMPNNTVLYDDRGLPSIMVRIPKFNISDVLEGGSNSVHPAFVVNGVEVPEIYISKYHNIVIDDRAYSLPMQDPRVYVTADQAKAYCENKGTGWHRMTNAEWAAIAMWCLKNGFMPRGNNSYSRNISYSHEKGVVTYTYDDGANRVNGRVATGSGAVTWAHDGTNAGIFDLNGNVWEEVAGMRLVNGEIQVIPDNNAAAGVDDSVTSTLWKAIKPDGTLVTPGTEGTLKVDAIGANGSGGSVINTTIKSQGVDNTTNMYTEFISLTAKSGVIIPEIMKVLGLFPYSTDCGADGFWARNNGERSLIRGGSWDNDLQAGLFALNLLYPQSLLSLRNVGFRSAFISISSHH